MFFFYLMGAPPSSSLYEGIGKTRALLRKAFTVRTFCRKPKADGRSAFGPHHEQAAVRKTGLSANAASYIIPQTPLLVGSFRPQCGQKKAIKRTLPLGWRLKSYLWSDSSPALPRGGGSRRWLSAWADSRTTARVGGRAARSALEPQISIWRPTLLGRQLGQLRCR